MNLKIFDKKIAFNKAAKFSKILKSPAGSVVSISTKWNEPKIKVRLHRAAMVGSEEHILQIPLNNKHYAIGEVGRTGMGVVVPTQKTAVIPGPKPKMPKPNPNPKTGFSQIITIGDDVMCG